MKRIFTGILCLALLVVSFSACSPSLPDAENPVTLTMWHVYGSQTHSPLNTAIDEFNRTVGYENGITVDVVSVTSSSAIDQSLAAAANGEPGAEHLPDLFTAYPRTVEIIGADNLLSWNDYFTEEELDVFTESFLSEGYFDGRLLMLPVAKSTEAFFLNQTLFVPFSSQTGILPEQLRTFDGLFSAARTYYDWSGGHNFMQINDYYNYAYIGMKSFGSEFVLDGKLQLEHENFEKIWTPLAKTAIYGGICLEDGYAASRWKTVEIISNIGSTADVLYQPDEVIYSNNTTEPITALALPYPVFTEEEAHAVYRGGGLFALKNVDERKNQAACIFAAWLTEKEHNLAFVTEAGYVPVIDEAFDVLFADINTVKNEKYHSVYETVGTMLREYTFHALPLYAGASDVQHDFEYHVKDVLRAAHKEYLERIRSGEDSEAVLNELSASSLDELRQFFA